MNMKKVLLTLALIIVIMQCRAQSFEGIVKWAITMDITDPKMKADMEKAQKQMNDPANQAKIKEMEEKMNDPQFKAMMESNPQMKAQMDAAMNMMKSGNLSSFIPKSSTVKVKDGNTLFSMEGGIMSNFEVLSLKGKDESYQLDRQNKTYFVMPHNTESTETDKDVKVTKTSETAKILGYSCTKYIVEYSDGKHKMQQILWATKDIPGLDLKNMGNSKMNRSQTIYYDKIDGAPLKIEMHMEQGNMVMEAKEIKKQSLPASEFTIPSDFKKVDMPYGNVR
jgi:hypothetical protein